ncbi:ATP-binding protein [Nocardioides sp. BP30]|uniref:sensor histidine kinase n=1 Tax=Nocardioides sp. BP30 TaxID=3036374 RepID=UPI002469444B|nr:HAMP domain-containing sensor histidine kinase [Nocardioides sp. BP30]WGL51404.1 ATP-binding protein [Nocardioides sp. BP30]
MAEQTTGPPRRRGSLRVRLVVVLVSLLAVVLATVGLVTVLALRGFLIGRLDASLEAAGGRTAQAGQPPSGGGSAPDPQGNRFLLAPGQASGTLGARISDAVIQQAGVLQDDGSIRNVSTGSVASLLKIPTDGRPHTARVGTLGQYRLLAVRTSSGDVLVTGLPLDDVQRTVYRLIAVEAAVAAGAIVAATIVGSVLVRRTLRPLQRVAQTAERVSELPLAEGEVALTERIAQREVDDRTEVGQVAGSVNRLLDHVTGALNARHESETNVRRFVADASHELRTPLTAIRGYAELTRRLRQDTAPEIAHAMERVESETARMTAMVEDLLLLARLDTAPELAHEPVDLTHLLLDVVSDAAASGPDHAWRTRLPADPVWVYGDPHGLHQVFANLLANARVHTPPGTAVTASLTTSSPLNAVVTILDDGPGIPAPALPTVFERFARAESSRSRATGSTGLGLAIVRAIVEAHRGTVEVTSRPGQTAFVVRLPVE